MRGTRVAAEAQLWSRWKPIRLGFRFACGGPTTGGGTLVIAWNPDPDYQVAAGSQAAINAAMASQSNVIVRLDTIGAFPVPCTTVARWLLTDLTAEIGAHGTIFAVLISPPAGIKGKVSVTVSLDWTISWNGQELADSASAPATHIIFPDEGWWPVFTTSDSSFNSSILTFKERSGGSMVPWGDAMPGVVYTLAPGSKVPYYERDAAGKSVEKEAKWFSLVLNYSVRGLLLHASEQSAADYQRTADVVHALPYVSAGNRATPNRLALVSVPRITLVKAPGIPSMEAILDRLTRIELHLAGRPEREEEELEWVTP